jgi:hypothetical protein
MTISYEDAAEVIVDHLAPSGRFSRKARRCCIADRSQTAQTLYAWLVSRMMRPFFPITLVFFVRAKPAFEARR